MKKYNAFTFVELLMVMLVLGIIISLTMPLLSNIVNSDDVNRSYMRKAIQDVTDATALALVKDRFVFGDASSDNCTRIRDKFKLSMSGSNILSTAWADLDLDANQPGINVGNKSEIYFLYAPAPPAGDEHVGLIYYDVNGSKKPNKPCEDRYRFILYPDKATIDPALGCSLAIQN